MNDKNNFKNVTTMINRDKDAKLTSYAKRNGISKSEVIRRAIEDYLERN